MQPILTIRNLSLSYNSRVIYSDFNLEIKPGEKLLIKGDSGVGKTTLLRLILGFEQPDHGTITLMGQTISPDTIWECRKRCAYVSQDTHIGNLTVEEFFEQVFHYKANKTLHVVRGEIVEQMTLFGLKPETYEAHIKNLSGGERQRIAITAAVLLKRPIYLLDEITSALDDKLKKTVASFFMKQTDKTLIIVSHDNIWEEYKNVKLLNLS